MNVEVTPDTFVGVYVEIEREKLGGKMISLISLMYLRISFEVT